MKIQERIFVVLTLPFLWAFACYDTAIFEHQLLELGSSDEFAMCDGCWCIKDAGGGECRQPVPPQAYTDLLPSLRALELTNPLYELDCDPYESPDCDTTPPLEQGGACVVKTDCSAKSYELQSYGGTAQEAIDEGLIVTHEGPCATCSTLQDLSIYMEFGAELSARSEECGIFGLVNLTRGFECFVRLGMTDSCAWTWAYNTRNTRKECGALCTAFLISGDPSNGPPPNCTLAECLQCDEDNSGAIFKQFSGRTRRNSYLWSNIGRPCSVYGVALNHTDPCPPTAPPTDSPTDASSGNVVSPFRSFSRIWREVAL